METDPNSRHAHGEPNRPLCVFVLSRHSVSLHPHNIQQLLETLTVLSLQVNLWKTRIISPVDTHNVCIQHTVSVNVMSVFTASAPVVFFLNSDCFFVLYILFHSIFSCYFVSIDLAAFTQCALLQLYSISCLFFTYFLSNILNQT